MKPSVYGVACSLLIALCIAQPQVHKPTQSTGVLAGISKKTKVCRKTEDRVTKANYRMKREREQLKNKEIKKFYHSKNWPGTTQRNYLLQSQSQIYCPAREVTVAAVGYLQRQKWKIKNSVSSSTNGRPPATKHASCIGTAANSFFSVILNQAKTWRWL